MTVLLTLKRSQARDVAVGNSRGAWSVPQLGLRIQQSTDGQWVLLTAPGDDTQQRAWLKRVDLADQRFDRRRDALAALRTAVAVTPPSFLCADPCLSCDNTGWRQYDDNHASICADCCPHDQGWWQLRDYYGPRNGSWACRRGCGTLRPTRPSA